MPGMELRTVFGPPANSCPGISLNLGSDLKKMSAISRWTIRAVVTAAAALAVTFTSPVPASAAVSLLQISSDPYHNPTSNHRTQVEPDTFAFGSTIVSAFQSGRFFDGGASNIGWATSTNSGTTWVHGFLPGTTVFAHGIYQRVSDPSVAYDARHKVWLVSYLGIMNPATDPVDVLVSRSTNGLSWGNPVVVNATGVFNDKNWTVCDNFASSPFYGHCYTQFDNASTLNRVQMSTSTNGGLSWGAAKTTPDQTCVIGGQPVVQPNGTVIVPIDDCFATSILSFRSTDGGRSWSRTVKAAQILNDGHPGSIRSLPLPSAEIDRTGRIYVVWDDCRTQDACNAGNNDLLLITSRDGLYWTLPQRIPIDAVGSGVDHLIPGLAVDPRTSGATAHLGLAYYYFPSIDCTPSTCQLNVGFVSSTNGGATWSSARKLAGPITLTWLPLTTQGFMVGDYISTSIPPGTTDASPVFAGAHAPTPPPNCSDLNTGAPGQGCHEAMYTTLGLKITGGTHAAGQAAPALTQMAAERLLARATAF